MHVNLTVSLLDGILGHHSLARADLLKVPVSISMGKTQRLGLTLLRLFSTTQISLRVYHRSCLALILERHLLQRTGHLRVQGYTSMVLILLLGLLLLLLSSITQTFNLVTYRFNHGLTQALRLLPRIDPVKATVSTSTAKIVLERWTGVALLSPLLSQTPSMGTCHSSLGPTLVTPSSQQHEPLKALVSTSTA